MKILLCLLLSFSLSVPVLAEDNDIITLGGDVQAQLKSYNFDFGRTTVNTTKSTRLYLRNDGRFPVYINSIDIRGDRFAAEENCPRLLWPGERCTIRVAFRPNYVGFFYGQLNIDLTGSEDIRVNLRGRGVWGF